MIKVKNFVLGIGIFIVFMFLLHNGIRAFYPSPEYNDYCSAGRFAYSYPSYPEKAGIVAQNCSFSRTVQQDEQACYNKEGQPVYEYDDNGCVVSVVECDLCQKNFDDATKAYNKVVFVIALIIGIITLIIGYSVLSVEPVGSALMASGIGAIVYGTIVNWENLGNLGRFLLLLLALVLLIWIALRLNVQKKKGFFSKLGFGS